MNHFLILHRQKKGLWTPIKWIVFSHCSRIWNYKSTQSYHSNNQSTLPPLPPQILLPPRSWVVTWPAATRVFFPTTREEEEKEPGNEVVSVRNQRLWSHLLFYANWLCMNYIIAMLGSPVNVKKANYHATIYVGRSLILHIFCFVLINYA